MCYPNSDKESAAPATEPITTAEAKTHLRISHTDDDTYIDTLVKTARLTLENIVRRAFVTQTRISRYDAFPDVFEHQRAPLVSVTTLTYTDTNGDSQTLGASFYTVDANTDPGRIVPAYGTFWPSTRDIPNAVVLTYVCGYGAASAVPETVKTCLKRLVSHWYDNREPVVIGTIFGREAMPWDVGNLIAAFDTGVWA